MTGFSGQEFQRSSERGSCMRRKTADAWGTGGLIFAVFGVFAFMKPSSINRFPISQLFSIPTPFGRHGPRSMQHHRHLERATHFEGSSSPAIGDPREAKGSASVQMK
jgi:hypothetical protein